ncbi:universal stress protein [Lujinxingia vulgaris]|uniref:Universal stress protein n=1 Tax=Lujinxingia vulgaris TaxID=2600176 RepID=A0A5C6XDD4_9DELT|nr:universal stress protein [Lujinxingia vulgaris]TXD36112.1 universal stress protein [Lujinxingia vulgaris]
MKILLATDLSLEAESAARWALDLRERILATERSASLSALYVAPPEHYSANAGERLAENPDINARQTHQVREWLRTLSPHTDDIDILLEEGKPATVITNYCTTHQVDWLVLGTSGAGAISRAMLGSTAMKLVHRAPCKTVLVQPDHATLSEPPGLSVALDFMPGSQAALFSAAHLAHLTGAQLDLVHILHDTPTPTLNTGLVNYLSPQDIDQLTERTRECLIELGVEVKTLYPELTFESHVYAGPTVATLTQHCETHSVDLLILGKKSRSALQDRALGSIASAMARKHPTSLMLVPPEDHLDR